MTRFVFSALGAVLLTFAACDDLTGPEPGTVTADFELRGLRVENGRGAPIHYFLIERELAALVDWRPCVDDTHGACPTIPPRSDRLFPYHEIPGWGHDSDEALFYWWHTVSGPADGLTYDSIRVIVVRR